MPRVSVIIPCFNDGAFIDEAIHSALRQTYSDIEIIVVDDGSDDGETRKKLEAYESSSIRVIYQPPRGVAVARNVAIEQTSGEYILPLDADDRIHETYIEKAVRVMDSDSNLGIVYCLAEFFGERTGPWDVPDASLERMLLGNLIFCSALFRRGDWLKVGGYNPNMRYGFEDWDLWLSIIGLKREVYRIPEILFSYRTKSVSRSTLITEDLMLDMRVQLFYNHQKLYIDNIRSLLRSTVEVEKLNYEFINSRTWRLTKPFRTIASIFQRKC